MHSSFIYSENQYPFHRKQVSRPALSSLSINAFAKQLRVLHLYMKEFFFVNIRIRDYVNNSHS